MDLVLTPDWTVPPGETLRECLEERDMTQVELARRTRVSIKHINQIVKGHVPISVPTAVKLERVLGVDALMWLRLDAQYQLDLYRKRHATRRGHGR
jgi:HTH-type transcriptional regulator / antitoxin HigA